jgi:hypothetical protein
MISVVGLLLALGAWLLVMQIIVWTWNQHVAIMVAAGAEIDDRDRRMRIRRVARRHTLGWTSVFFVFFVLLLVADFPLWQVLAFSFLLAFVYGANAIARGESEWVGRENPRDLALFGPRRDALLYRMLAVADWAAYLAGIAFAADVLFSLVT